LFPGAGVLQSPLVNDRDRQLSSRPTRKARRPHLHLVTFEPGRVRLPVSGYADVLTARKIGAQFAARLGFPAADIAVIATLVSELTRVIIDSGEPGNVTFTTLTDGGRRGLEVVVRHKAAALPSRERRETAGVSKLPDTLQVTTEEKSDIAVTLKKWRTP
jgi:serine/threonine-protein kinase RsbT